MPTSPHPPPSGASLLFGPVTFLREREAPKTEEVSFVISDTTGPFLLRLTNGDSDGGQRVSSALVKLNGSEVFRPSQFNQNVATLSRQVVLLSGENSLEVRLRSVPGSFVTIEIFRLDQHACPVLGLHTFIRSTGKPVEETVAFELGPQFTEPFVMSVNSGNPDGSNTVDSATITLNGMLIFDPNDFNEQTSFLSEVVSLIPANTLNVQISGAPGDLLTVEIIGYDNTPPSVTIANPSNGATFTESPITVTGTVDDPSSSVTVNGIAVPVGSDGSFIVEEISLLEGENPIRVVATDSCGNQGEDQISVYLRTVPQGPYLLFCAEPFYERRPDPPEPGCGQQIYQKDVGAVTGLTDETAVSVTVDRILFPDGVLISDQGRIYEGMREGTFFWAFVSIPQVDGRHPFTAVVTDAEGRRSEATVYFLVDNVPPQLMVTSPSDGMITNRPTITVSGTVDDPEAMVRIGWYGSFIPVVDGSFTATYTLPREGTNYLTITARDPAENYAYVSLRVILDTQPPQINVTYPAEGQAVNTPTLNIAGSMIDQNNDTVTVEANNGPPQPLTLVGSNFSGTVTLSPGPNTLAFNATDKAGNSTRVSRSVTLDLDPPTVAITSPISGAILSGIATVTVDSSDATSGIASVALFVDGQLQTTLNQPPFSFTLDTSLLPSGLHTITVRATDGAGNQGEASVDVTVDNTAPIVAITSPRAGAFVSGLITVSVQAGDAISGISSVSLHVDGLQQATLTQPPFDFPLNTLLFGSGNHTLTATAVDNSGNQAEASIIVSFDHIPPAVSITSPASGATVSGTITVTVEASDSISGIASVTLFVDTQPHSTLNQQPFNFTVDTSVLTPGSHTLTVRALDRVENQGEAGITVQVSALRVEIVYPADGATINKPAALVQGKIYNAEGEIGVVVNGVLAEVQGSDFTAIVPLQIGQNILTAVATTVDGFQVQTSITINTTVQQEVIRFTATPASGILNPLTNILEVTLEAEAYLLNPVSSYSWDLNGDGAPEIAGTEAKITAQYQFPGLYFPTVTVMDTQGNSYSDITIVNVLSREAMDALLRSKWEGMKTALGQGNISDALNYFVTDSREEYREIFELLAPQLPALVSAMREINMVEVTGNMAEYCIKRFQRGVDISYFIYFIRDENGIWRISSF